jgi:hypothetical protein
MSAGTNSIERGEQVVGMLQDNKIDCITELVFFTFIAYEICSNIWPPGHVSRLDKDKPCRLSSSYLNRTARLKVTEVEIDEIIREEKIEFRF